MLPFTAEAEQDAQKRQEVVEPEQTQRVENLPFATQAFEENSQPLMAEEAQGVTGEVSANF